MRRSLSVIVVVCALAACGSSTAASSRSTTAASSRSTTAASSRSTTAASSVSTGATTSSPAAATVAHCGPASAATLAGSPGARVYRRGNSAYGCAAGGAHSYRLGAYGGSCINASLVGPIAVGGRLAAYGAERCGVDTGSGTVVVRNLASGHELYTHVAVAFSRPESYEQVGSIVVSGAGAVAWIGHGASIVGHTSLTAVYERSGSGARQLDSGAAIAEKSLRRTGPKISWRHGGAIRSAALS